MRRLVIAVDCDDVLVPTTPFFVSHYNQRYGTNVQLADSHTESDDIWGVSHAQMLERFAEVMQTDEYRKLGPSAEEAAILRELAQDHELHLVTARKEEERAFTKQLLDTQLPGVFTSMEFVGWRGSKGVICQSVNADVLVDDNARHLRDALECGLPAGGALLFGNYAWNKTAGESEDLFVCTDWRAVKDRIDEIAQSPATQA